MLIDSSLYTHVLGPLGQTLNKDTQASIRSGLFRNGIIKVLRLSRSGFPDLHPDTYRRHLPRSMLTVMKLVARKRRHTQVQMCTAKSQNFVTFGGNGSRQRGGRGGGKEIQRLLAVKQNPQVVSRCRMIYVNNREGKKKKNPPCEALTR